MILVTGGTGLVGSHLLYFLLKENGNVRAIH
ncbi:MAG: NAD-dependent epimerase/dehydratase family protein, partial [Aequorivita vladivostokensis]|nr:NAD-dependent epimerase/dehydratase family protein [Aequorivita vladivostokensis]